MPNTFAYIALLGWPLVVVAFFRFLSLPSALVFSVVGGYLFLPEKTYYDFAYLPPIDKTSIPSVSAAIMCFWLTRSRVKKTIGARLNATQRGDPNRAHRGGSSDRQAKIRSKTIMLLIGGLLACPWITVWFNQEPVVAGPRVISGLSVYDALAMSANMLLMIIPFFLGNRFLASPETHLKLLKAITGLGLVYSLLVLFEARMSPQLNIWTYGFFAHDWLQHLREGGFRPIVFLNHGLWVASFMSMACLSTLTLLRCSKRDGRARALFSVIWLAVTLIFCRSLGAVVVTTAIGLATVLISPRKQVPLAASVAFVIFAYPMLRSADLIPVERIQAAAEWVSKERAESFAFRLHNEDILLERAELKPIAGWGGWGRNRVWSRETGQDTSEIDGQWILVFSLNGWMGYVAIFGLLTAPTILLWRRGHLDSMPAATLGLITVMVAALIDLIPNATLTPVTWLFAGAIAGYYNHARGTAVARPQSRTPVSQNRSGDLVSTHLNQATLAVRTSYKTKTARVVGRGQ